MLERHDGRDGAARSRDRDVRGRLDRFAVVDAHHAHDVVVGFVEDIEVAAVVDGGEARVRRELEGFETRDGLDFYPRGL